MTILETFKNEMKLLRPLDSIELFIYPRCEPGRSGHCHNSCDYCCWCSGVRHDAV